MKELVQPLPGAGLQPPPPAGSSLPVVLSPAITFECFKKQAEYTRPMKRELLPSAAPSARDSFSNGKDQSLRLVQSSFRGSAGMDRAALSCLPESGRKMFP